MQKKSKKMKKKKNATQMRKNMKQISTAVNRLAWAAFTVFCISDFKFKTNHGPDTQTAVQSKITTRDGRRLRI